MTWVWATAISRLMRLIGRDSAGRNLYSCRAVGAGVSRSQDARHYIGAMNRPNLMLLALAAAGSESGFTPVQVQKLFFLLDRRGHNLLGGPHFDFAPYDYGPFDPAVYQELDSLERVGLLRIDTSGRYRKYKLSVQGYEQGSDQLAQLSGPVRDFVRKTVEWVRGLRFDQLVAAIYREYPEMKAKSIFNQ